MMNGTSFWSIKSDNLYIYIYIYIKQTTKEQKNELSMLPKSQDA